VIDLLEKTNKQSNFFGQPYNVYAYICALSGQSIGCVGDFTKGIALCEKGLQYASELNDNLTLGFCEYMYGALLNLKHDFKPAVTHLLNALSYFAKVKFKAMLGLALSHLIHAYTGLGDLLSAGNYLEKFIEVPYSDRRNWISFSNFMLSAYHIASGDTKAAKRCCEEGLRLSRQDKNKFGEGVSLMALGRSLGEVDPSEFKPAIKTIHQGLEILEGLKLKAASFQGYLYLGELYSTLDSKKEANENLQRAQLMCQEMGIDYWLPKIQHIMAKL
jgi:tetratricopeptide (TPR) repeat protein